MTRSGMHDTAASNLARVDPSVIVEVGIHLVRPQIVGVPEYQTSGASGLDLQAAIDAPQSVAPGKRVRIPTGIAVAIPQGYEGQVRPRSGLAFRHGVTVLNAPGTIDSDYTGEIEVLLVHLGSELVQLEPGQRIAQLIFAPVVQVSLNLVRASSELGITSRGAQGFGSTGD
ncbi:MAG: dUTP diphosphatase [Myxococcota bacterium]